jgi:hypothetical protein
VDALVHAAQRDLASLALTHEESGAFPSTDIGRKDEPKVLMDAAKKIGDGLGLIQHVAVAVTMMQPQHF